MTATFDSSNHPRITATISSNAESIAAAFSACFGTNIAVEVPASEPWTQESTSDRLQSPGLALTFEVADLGLMCFIPASLLPAWIESPSEEENDRLQHLMEAWSGLLVPDELTVAQTAFSFVTHLDEELNAARPHDEARFLSLNISSASAAAEESPDGESESNDLQGESVVVWPVRNPPVPILYDEGEYPAESAETAPSAPVLSTQERLQRVRNLPISVSVRLAEKKIDVEQLMSITPGGLITFDKPCEDLLDMYVNNQLMFRGEAVKIGEKFGLKINEVGSVKIREPKIVNY